MTLTFDQALGSPNPRVGIFFRLALASPLRLWLGIGNCKAGIDAADGAGQTYQGFGELLNVPTFQQLINGTADRVSFRLSYVSQRVAQMASTESDDVKGVEFKVGIGLFDKDWALIATPIWLRTFIIDYLTVERDQSSGEAIWTVSLAARTLFTGRRRPGLSFWTNNDQDARHSGDKFCERAVLYSVDNTKAWPKL